MFTFVPAPSVLSLSPSVGPMHGGTVVTLAGAHFQPVGMLCKFSSSELSVPATYISATQISCPTPPTTMALMRRMSNVPRGGAATGPTGGAAEHAHAAAMQPISVRAVIGDCGNGNECASVTAPLFRYVPPIVVHRLTPIGGPETGGTVVQVIGLNLPNSPTLGCSFDTHTSNAVAVRARYVSSTMVECVSPPHTMADGVRVDLTEDGVILTEDDAITGGAVTFAYHASTTVRQLFPNAGPTAGGTSVTVFGTNFVRSGLLSCKFGLVQVPAAFVSAVELTCISPAHAPATIAIEVSNNGVDFTSSLLPFAFRAPPLVRYVTPAAGPVGGGTPIRVYGVYFPNVTSLACRFGTGFGSAAETGSGGYDAAGAASAAGTGYENDDRMSEEGAVKSVVVPARWISDTEVWCVTPAAPIVGLHPLYASAMIAYINVQTRGDEAPAANGKATVAAVDRARAAPFLFRPRVRLNFLSPAFGSASGNTPVRVTGANFVDSDALTCRFATLESGKTEEEAEDGEYAMKIVRARYLSPSEIQCVSPAMVLPGEALVYVSNNGVDVSEEALPFHFAHSPSITSVEPASCLSEGGCMVTIRGKMLAVDGRSFKKYSGSASSSVTSYDIGAGRTYCRFGLAPPVPAITMSANELKCVAPDHVEGTVKLEITNNEVDFTSDLFNFTYTPSHGFELGADGVGGVRVTFESEQDQSSDYDWRESFGTAWNVAVNEITPSRVPSDGGTELYVAGHNFSDSANLCCRFGDGTGLGVGTMGNGGHWDVVTAYWYSSTEIRCNVPRHAPGFVFVEVSNDGVSFTRSGVVLEYYVSASVNWVRPTHGPEFGSTGVTVYGSHFKRSAGLLCRFGTTVVAAARYVSTTEIVCVTPSVLSSENVRPGGSVAGEGGGAGGSVTSTGSVTLEVSNNNGTSWSDNRALFTYDPAVIVRALTPATGPATGGTEVLILGSNFLDTEDAGELRCRFDGVVVPAYYVSPTELFCDTPVFALTGGIVGEQPHRDVQVEVSVNGIDFSFTGSTFAVVPSARASSLWPTNGPALTGNTVVTVFGTGFANTLELSCFFGHMMVPAEWLSSTTLRCQAPPNMPGIAHIRVSNNRHDLSNNGGYDEASTDGAYAWHNPAGSVADEDDEAAQPLNFLYVKDASVFKLTPNRGLSTGHQPVFISGSNFVNTTALGCRFGNAHVRATFVSRRAIMCLAPSRAANVIHSTDVNVAVEVSNNGLDFTDSRVIYRYIGTCPAGHYCPYHDVLTCPNGTSCDSRRPTPNAGNDKRAADGAAFTHEIGAFNFSRCEPGYFQPRSGQIRCLRCPVGYFCPDHGMSKPIICTAGHVCDGLALRTPLQLCPKGHYCGTGTKSADPAEYSATHMTRWAPAHVRGAANATYTEDLQAKRRGAHPDGSVWVHGVLGDATSGFGYVPVLAEWRTDNESGVSTFRPEVRAWPYVQRKLPATGQVRREHPPYADKDCQHGTCTAGRQHDGGLNFALVAEQPIACPVGHYCRSGAASAIPIPKNFSSPQRCFDGFFCPRGSHTPEGTGPCPTGFYCPTQTEAYTCPRGQYCAGVGNTKPNDCYPGTYNPDLGRSNCTLCPTGHICPGWRRLAPEICPAGFVCVALGLSAPVLLCPAGYFCGEGTLTLNPQDSTPLRPQPCPAGTFCLAGVAHNLTIDWVPSRPDAATAPQTCTEGAFCEVGSAQPSGSGPCFPGHYCPPGSEYPTEAPIGSFVEKNGSVAATLCFPGSYAPLKSTIDCRVCPAGFTCQGYGTYEPSICPAGTYRSLADSVTCRLCPQGSWSPLAGTPDISLCEPCPAGRVCGTQQLNDLVDSTPCPKGYLCSLATTRSLQFAHKCPAGFVCGTETTPAAQYDAKCPAGYFCRRGTRDDEAERNKCPVNFYCPLGTATSESYDTRCPEGTTSLAGSTSLADCQVRETAVCDKLEGVSYYPEFEYTFQGEKKQFNSASERDGTGEVPVLKKINPINLTSSSALWVNDTVEVFRSCPSNGTHKGGTEITIIGRNFRKSPLLSCRFRPRGSAYYVIMPAVFESSTRVKCMTPKYKFQRHPGNWVPTSADECAKRFGPCDRCLGSGTSSGWTLPCYQEKDGTAIDGGGGWDGIKGCAPQYCRVGMRVRELQWGYTDTNTPSRVRKPYAHTEDDVYYPDGVVTACHKDGSSQGFSMADVKFTDKYGEFVVPWIEHTRLAMEPYCEPDVCDPTVGGSVPDAAANEGGAPEYDMSMAVIAPSPAPATPSPTAYTTKVPCSETWYGECVDDFPDMYAYEGEAEFGFGFASIEVSNTGGTFSDSYANFTYVADFNYLPIYKFREVMSGSIIKETCKGKDAIEALELENQVCRKERVDYYSLVKTQRTGAKGMIVPRFYEEGIRQDEEGWFMLKGLALAKAMFDFRAMPKNMVYDEHFKIAIYVRNSTCVDLLCDSNRQRIPGGVEENPCKQPVPLSNWFLDKRVDKHTLVNLTVYALEDVLVKFEIHLMYGLWLPYERFFHNTTTVTIHAPARANHTEGIIPDSRPLSPVVSREERLVPREYVFTSVYMKEQSEDISPPLNLPPKYKQLERGRVLVSFNKTDFEEDEETGEMSGWVRDPLLGDTGVKKGAEWWVKPAGNDPDSYALVQKYRETFHEMERGECRAQADEFGEIEEGCDYSFAFDMVVLPYVPYFSNCAGHDSYIPWFDLLEDDTQCQLPSIGTANVEDGEPRSWWRRNYPAFPHMDDIYVVGPLQLLEAPTADWCERTLHCKYEEDLSQVDVTPRWFETGSGDELFMIYREPTTFDDYLEGGAYIRELLSGGQGSDVFVPIAIDRDAADEYPGECLRMCFPRQVSLELMYYQFDRHYKRLITAELIFEEFDEVFNRTDYDLNVVYRPLNYIELIINFAFEKIVYIVLFILIGSFTVFVAALFWLVNRLTTSLQSPPRFRFWGFLALIAPPPAAGVCLALMPVTVALIAITMIMRGFDYMDPASVQKAENDFWMTDTYIIHWMENKVSTHAILVFHFPTTISNISFPLYLSFLSSLARSRHH
jgi:hypothetical protein